MKGTNSVEHSLKEIEPADFGRLFEWRNSDKIRKFMFRSEPITWEEHIRWLETTVRKQPHLFRIYKIGQKPLGYISFNPFDTKDKHCFWGFYIGADDAPKGSGYKMCVMGLEYAFQELEIRKISAEVLEYNERSRRLHERLYFQIEGCFKKHVYKNGQYFDVLRYALFYDDWIQNRERFTI